jgi:hypothetical protein
MAAAHYNYLSAPLGGQPRKRRNAMNLDVPQIVAGLALLLAVFMLWMAISNGPPAREPANLRIAAKPVDPPATTPQAVAPPAIHPKPDNQEPSALPTNSTTITIIDGKTGEKKEVVVSAPALAVASPAATTRTPAMQSGTADEKDSKTIATAPADRSIVGLNASASLPDLRGAATIAAAPPSLSASSAPGPSLPDSNDFIDEVMPAVASVDGATPLPRRRPASFAMVQNAAMPTVVPLPRARPQVAAGTEPEPMSDTAAELMNDTSSGHETGLSGRY